MTAEPHGSTARLGLSWLMSVRRLASLSVIAWCELLILSQETNHAASCLTPASEGCGVFISFTGKVSSCGYCVDNLRCPPGCCSGLHTGSSAHLNGHSAELAAGGSDSTRVLASSQFRGKAIP